MWTIKQHKTPTAKQELQVKILLNDLKNMVWVTSAQSLKDMFDSLILEVPKSNNHSADLMYQSFITGDRQLEIWKMTVTNERKVKMWTLDYQPA